MFAEAADETGIARLMISEKRLTPRTLPEWLRALHVLVHDFKPDVVHAQSMPTTAADGARRSAHAR